MPIGMQAEKPEVLEQVLDGKACMSPWGFFTQTKIIQMDTLLLHGQL